jgi:uncharacterized protein
MMAIQAFIQRHPVFTYFVLTFAISWGGFLMAVGGPGAMPGSQDQVDRLLPFAMLVWLAGPSVAGILLTVLVHGRAGFRTLLSRMTRWRVDARWYAVAILTAPLLMTAVLLALSLTSPDFLPGILTTGDPAALLLFGIGWGLIGGGFLEELGWTGFAIPELRLRHSVLTTGFIVGILWGVFHFPVHLYMLGTSAGTLPLAVFLPMRGFDILLGLSAFRVLIVWVYDHTESLLVAMLMHASLTASTFILGPLALAGGSLLAYTLTMAAVQWLVVAAVAVTNRGNPSRSPLRRQTA